MCSCGKTAAQRAEERRIAREARREARDQLAVQQTSSRQRIDAITGRRQMAG